MFNECRVYVGNDENTLGIDNGDGTTLQIMLRPLNYTLTNKYNGKNYVMYISLQ